MRRGPVRALALLMAVLLLAGCGGSATQSPGSSSSSSSSGSSGSAGSGTSSGSSGASNPSSSQANLPDEIEIGIITALTGSEAKFGEAHMRGYQIALEEINAAGGVLGRPLKLIVEDDASKPENAISAAEKLATQTKVPLIIGSYSSAATLPAAQTATTYQVPFIVPTAAADNITEFGSRYVFRINSPSSEYASTVVNFLMDQVKPKTMAIVYENTSFGTSTAQPARELAEKAGIQVVAYEGYAKGAPDFKPLITKVKAANPDVVLYVSYLLDATLLMRQARELDFNPKVYIGAGAGFSTPEFVREEGAGKDAEYTFSATLWTTDVAWKGAKEFAEEFEKRYGVEPAYHSAETHAALYLVKDVLERAGSLDREAVRQALAETDMGPDATIFGPMKFNEKGQNAHPMLVTQVQDGNYVTVWPSEYAAAAPILPTPTWSERK